MRIRVVVRLFDEIHVRFDVTHIRHIILHRGRILSPSLMPIILVRFGDLKLLLRDYHGILLTYMRLIIFLLLNLVI